MNSITKVYAVNSTARKLPAGPNIVIFIHQINGRHQDKKGNKKIKLN